jgi:hypothetical protein
MSDARGWYRKVQVLSLLVCGLAAGCAREFRPPGKGVVQAPEAATASGPAVVSIGRTRYGRWVYERRSLMGGDSDTAQSYVRLVRPGRRIEGEFVGKQFGPIAGYLRRPEMTPEQMEGLPKAPIKHKRRAAYMIEIASPAPLCPESLRLGETQTDRSEIGVFDYRGHRTHLGTVERTAAAEGIEDVRTPAGLYPGCVRVRTEIAIRLSFAVRMDVELYQWFAPGFGEVRRVEHFTALVWVFWMESAYDYVLRAFVPDDVSAARAAGERMRKWSRAAIWFDRTFPRPRVAGLYIELVNGGGTRPATGRAAK